MAVRRDPKGGIRSTGHTSQRCSTAPSKKDSIGSEVTFRKVNNSIGPGLRTELLGGANHASRALSSLGRSVQSTQAGSRTDRIRDAPQSQSQSVRPSTSGRDRTEAPPNATEVAVGEPTDPTLSYWTINSGYAIHPGNTCRECRKQIQKGDAIFVRTGRLSRLFYHIRCFSGKADPRTQKNSSYPQYMDRLGPKAPSVKGHGEWETRSYGWHGTSSLGITPSEAPAAASIFEMYAARKKGGRKQPTFQAIIEPVIMTYDP